MSKQIDILANETKTLNTNSVNVKEEKKEGSSLFDSLLTNAKTKVSDVEEKTPTKASTKGANISASDKKEEQTSSSKKVDTNNTKDLVDTKETSKNEKKDAILAKTENNVDTTKVEVKSSGSLLDRMILEAKNKIGDNSSLPTKIEKKDTKVSDSKKVDLSESNDDTKTSKKDANSNNENKVNTSSQKVESVLEKNEETPSKNSEKVDKKDLSEVDTNPTSRKKIDLKENTLVNNQTKINPESKDKNGKDLETATSTESKLENKVIKNTEVLNTVKKDLNSKSDENTKISTTESKNKVEIKEKNELVDSKDNKNKLIDSLKTVETAVSTKVDKKDLSDTKNTKSSDIITNELDDSESSEIVDTEIKTNKKEKKVETSSLNKTSVLNQDVDNEVSSEVKTFDNKSTESKPTEIKIADKKSNDTKNIDVKDIEAKKSELKQSNVKEEIKENSLDKKTVINDENTTSNKPLVNSEVKNEKAAEQLSKLANKTEERVDLPKASLENKNEIKEEVKTQAKEEKSLFDKIVDNKKTIETKVEDKKLDEKVVDQQSKTLDNPNKPVSEKNSRDVLTNIYLSTQKNTNANQNLAKKTEAINEVKTAKSTENVKSAAKKLDLELEKIDVEVENVENKNTNNTNIEKRNFLDRVAFNKNIHHDDTRNIINKSIEASKAILSDDTSTSTNNIINNASDVTLNVSPSLAQSIQSRIIGAKQQMSTMMSDVARQMYENYKPPVTAFRINLNPAHLGSIAIVMKNDKDNGINISMNISNSSTLDAFVDSQNGLKSALENTFEEDADFNLDFGSGENDSGDQSSNNGENAQKSFSRSNTQSILELRENNQTSEDKNLDYL